MIYTVYKTINLINHKEYIGFHSIKSLDCIIYEESANGSIFKDGYMGSGKLIKRALEKYGPMNMKQHLIYLTNNKEEAEEYEAELVNAQWTFREDTYNIALGDNVRIMIGKNNPMYGKPLSKKSLQQSLETRKKNNKIFSWSKLIEKNTDNIFYSYDDIYKHFNITDKSKKTRKHKLYELVFNGIIKYESEYMQKTAIKQYLAYEEILKNKPNMKKKLSEAASKRFSGVPKTKESNLKRGKAISKWIKENPDEHKKRMDKINKNPEKIKKTAAKHTGMKRNEETKRRISETSKGRKCSTKGKKFIYNIDTLETNIIDKNEILPIGWKYGFKPK